MYKSLTQNGITGFLVPICLHLQHILVVLGEMEQNP